MRSRKWNNSSSQLSLDKEFSIKRIADYPEDRENCFGWHGDVRFDNESNEYGVSKFDKHGV